jgi:bacillithiol system protein YtxJ
MKENAVVEVRTIKALGEVWERAGLVLFKHSTQCGLSAMAYQEMAQFAQEHREVEVHIVNVLESRAVSDEVERRTGVEHESPQVLIVGDGAVVRHASHRGVTAAALAGHVRELMTVAADAHGVS